MYVRDILQDAGEAIGSCELPVILRRLTDAQKTLADKALWDITLGEIDVCVYDGVVTLPFEVGTVLAVSAGGQPTLLRDEWYGYHINGSGFNTSTPCQYADVIGQFSTYREPSKPCYLVAQVASAIDNNKKLRVFGWTKEGKRIFTPGPSGALEDGFLVPTVYGTQIRANGVPAIARIDRVTKDVTQEFVKLIAVDPDDSSVNSLVGCYRPDETAPRYRRLSVAAQQWIRVKFRRRDNELRSVNDWITIENRQALILALRCLKFRKENDYAKAREAESEAVRILQEEENINQTEQVSAPQIINPSFPEQDDTLYY